MEFVLYLVVAGLFTGMVYALVAIGFVLIYRATSVINFAVGEFLLVGAFLTHTLALTGLPLLGALALALPGAFLLGVLVDRVAIRPLLGRSVIATIMATLGLSAALRGGAQVVWGSSTRGLAGAFPPWVVQWGQLVLTPNQVWATLLVTAMAGSLLVMLRFSRWGLVARAVSENPPAALALGIRARTVVAAVWGIAALVATAGGVLVASVAGVGPHLAAVGLRVLPVVILGGLDSVAGAVVGGLAVGLVEAFTTGYVEEWIPGAREVVPYLIVLAVVLLRPYGLFGTEEIERV